MADDIGNINAAPQVPVVECDHCHGTALVPRQIRIAFWQHNGLIVLRNIPAMVCPGCGTEYMSDQTIVRLDARRARCSGAARADATIIVPVFDFDGPD